MPLIHSTVNIYNSRCDVNGNRYWAFTFTDNRSGVTVSAMADHGSNVETIARAYNHKTKGDWDRGIAFHSQELPIRQFDRMVKGWNYAGCTGEDLAAWVRKALKDAKAAERKAARVASV